MAKIENNTECSELVLQSNASKCLTKCKICKVNDFKYKCPQCEIRACSAKCLKDHKTSENCKGTHHRNRHVGLDKFSDLEFSTDYRFISNVMRNVNSVTERNFNNLNQFQFFLPRLRNLMNAAQKRSIDLKFLTKLAHKHRTNKSYVKFPSNTMYWQVELIFLNADNYKVHDRVSESIPLKNILGKHLENDKNIEMYKSISLSNIRVLLDSYKLKDKFYELDLSENLNHNLKNKTIWEYPTLKVVFKENVDASMILEDDSDGEDKSVQENKDPLDFNLDSE